MSSLLDFTTRKYLCEVLLYKYTDLKGEHETLKVRKQHAGTILQRSTVNKIRHTVKVTNMAVIIH